MSSSLNFYQKFLLKKYLPLLDNSNQPISKDGEYVFVYTNTKIIDGILSTRTRFRHFENTAEWASVMTENIRLNPDQINPENLKGGDALVLLPDGNYNLDSNILRLDLAVVPTLNAETFLIETVRRQYEPINPNSTWYIRCEVRRNTNNDL